MDYSAFNSPFSDPEDESPFAREHSPNLQSSLHNSSLAHSGLSSPGGFGDEEDRGFQYSPVIGASTSASGYKPHLQQQAAAQAASQHPPHLQLPPQQPQQHHSGPMASPGLRGDMAQQLAQAQQQASQPQPRQQYHLTAKITGLERTGRKDPILKFDVHTNLPKFRTTVFRDVRRTHPEFLKLAQHLLSSNPECIVPSVPPPSTSAGVGTEEDETRVKHQMQRWLSTICSNDVLMRDEEMVFFVESDFGYSPVVRRKQPATGVRRKVIKQFAPPPDDTPELERARPVVKAFYLGTMETGQKVDRVVKARRGLGLAEGSLGNALAILAQNEAHPGMSNAFRKLGRTIVQVGDFHAAQATAEAFTLADPLNYHSSDAFIVKETLTNRQILMRDLESARKDTRSRLQTAEVLKSKTNIRRDKVDEALQSLTEAKQTEQHLDSKVRRVTGNLLVEQKKWFGRTTKDLRLAIRDHCLRQIEAERRTLATLEAVRPDIRAIDSSGGLSRLGRDAPPSSRRASLAASQGPKGDAWSGAPRAAGVARGEFGVPTVAVVKREEGIREEEEGNESDEEDNKLDAKSAASQLAGSTF
ncbi:hypothetical protein BZA77DRAFT_339955 [Pyronema omphalodes]|nr:hypothetical protein BZA77DRAFT_339955 [Pyronema omphalodes]